MRKIKKIFALLCCAAVLMAVAMPRSALAAPSTPSRPIAVINQDGFPEFAWSTVSGVARWRIRISRFSSESGGLSNWTTEEIILDPSVLSYTLYDLPDPYTNNWFSCQVQAYDSSWSASSWSNFSPRVNIPGSSYPSPTLPPGETPSPTWFPPLTADPLYTPLPTSTPVPTLIVGQIDFDNATVSWSDSGVVSYNMNGQSFSTEPWISQSFVANPLIARLNFDFSNSQITLRDNIYNRQYYQVGFKLWIDDYNVGDDLYLTMRWDDLRCDVAAPLIGDTTIVLPVSVMYEFTTVDGTRTVGETVIQTDSEQMRALGVGLSVPLDVEGINSVTIIGITGIPDLDLNHVLVNGDGSYNPFYMSGSRASLSWSNSYFIPLPPFEYADVDAINHQTSIISAFFRLLFSGLGSFWSIGVSLLNQLLSWLSGFKVDLFDVHAQGVSALLAGISDQTGSINQHLSDEFSQQTLFFLRGIVQHTQAMQDAISQQTSALISDIHSVFIPDPEVIQSWMAEHSVEFESGSTMDFARSYTTSLLSVFTADYSAEPPSLDLPAFSMQLAGSTHIIFPHTVIRLSEVIPEQALTVSRFVGDIILTILFARGLIRKIGKLLNLNYSSGSDGGD